MSSFIVSQDMIKTFLLRHPLIHVYDKASMTWYVMNDEAASPCPPALTDWRRNDLRKDFVLVATHHPSY